MKQIYHFVFSAGDVVRVEMLLTFFARARMDGPVPRNLPLIRANQLTGPRWWVMSGQQVGVELINLSDDEKSILTTIGEIIGVGEE